MNALTVLIALFCSWMMMAVAVPVGNTAAAPEDAEFFSERAVAFQTAATAVVEELEAFKSLMTTLNDEDVKMATQRAVSVVSRLATDVNGKSPSALHRAELWEQSVQTRINGRAAYLKEADARHPEVAKELVFEASVVLRLWQQQVRALTQSYNPSSLTEQQRQNAKTVRMFPVLFEYGKAIDQLIMAAVDAISTFKSPLDQWTLAIEKSMVDIVVSLGQNDCQDREAADDDEEEDEQPSSSSGSRDVQDRGHHHYYQPYGYGYSPAYPSYGYGHHHGKWGKKIHKFFKKLTKKFYKYGWYTSAPAAVYAGGVVHSYGYQNHYQYQQHYQPAYQHQPYYQPQYYNPYQGPYCGWRS